jgi:NAD(P)-dependent dehydrogenase (short-subunit alcohol dehydrogenase family)
VDGKINHMGYFTVRGGESAAVRSELPVAVVTGGNRGIGLEVCRQLAMLGYQVVLGSRDLRRGELAAKEINPEGDRVTACHLEVDNSVSVEAMAQWVRDRYGRTDVVVNNAATPPDRWAIASTTDLSPIAEALDTNLFGAWRVTQVLLPLLRASPRPRVVNVSSEGGSLALMSGGFPAYSVSKAALNALTRLMAGELARDGILVNAVCPGWTAGDGLQGGGRSYAQGAASVIWAVMLPNGGPTGTFTRDGRELPWLTAPLRPPTHTCSMSHRAHSSALDVTSSTSGSWRLAGARLGPAVHFRQFLGFAGELDQDYRAGRAGRDAQADRPDQHAHDRRPAAGADHQQVGVL